jgi:hypothetical protein
MPKFEICLRSASRASVLQEGMSDGFGVFVMSFLAGFAFSVCPVSGVSTEWSEGQCVPASCENYVIDLCWITNIDAGDWGGFLYFSCDGQRILQISRCVFANIRAGRRGGVAYIDYSAFGSSMTFCCVSDCYAFYGGALYLYGRLYGAFIEFVHV